MFTVGTVICTLGFLFCIFWIKKAENSKDRFFAVFSLLGCLIVGLSSFWGITYENDLLWYDQNEKNANIQIDFSATDVENTSILTKLNLVNSKTTPDEIKSIFGYNCTVDTSNKYTIEYKNPSYTLNSYSADFLRIEFNKKGTKIKQISWGYRNPQSYSSDGCYESIKKYLSEKILGTPLSSSYNTVDWQGFHLEDTSYYVLFQRVF